MKIGLIDYMQITPCKGSVEALGVYFSTNEEQSIKQNMEETITNIKKTR